jgi:hypothetical protein
MLYATPSPQGPRPMFPPRLFPQRTWEGYWTVEIRAPFHTGRKHSYKVHLLVLRAFLGDPPHEDMEGAHLDGNPQNPHVTNLQWVTRKENQLQRHWHGTCPCKIQPCMQHLT